MGSLPSLCHPNILCLDSIPDGAVPNTPRHFITLYTDSNPMVTLIGTRYGSLEAAISTRFTGVIVLDEDMAEDVVIPVNKSVTIDLNGHTLTNVAGPTFDVYGKLIIEDSVGTGVVKSVVKDKPAILSRYGALVTINGGTFTFDAAEDTNGYYVVEVKGSLSMLGGRVVGAKSSSAIAVGYYDSKTVPPGPATFNMSGGEVIHESFIAVKCDSSGVVTLAGGKITASASALQVWNKATVRGNVVLKGSPAVSIGNEGYESTKGTLSVTGGVFEGTDNDIAAISNYGENLSVTVTDGQFTHDIPAEFIAPGFVFVTGADGKKVPVRDNWTFIEGAPTTWGPTKTRTIIWRESVAYTAGGIVLPIIPENSVLISVTAKCGVVGYVSDGKLQLFRGTKEVTGTVEDLTAVFLHC